MIKKLVLLAANLCLVVCLRAQTLYVPGGTSGIGTSANGNVGIGINSPSFKFEVRGGHSFFDPDYNLYVPSTGSSYFWKGVDGVDNVRFSVWSKLTLYNPTVAGLNTNNSDWNIQLGARDGSIYTRGGAYFAINNGSVGIATISPSDALQVGDFNNSNDNKIKIPGAYNFEQVRLGQYGNGNCGLELVNHNGTTTSYGVRLMANVDEMPGLQIQIASPTNAYNSLAYLTKVIVNLDGNVGIGTITPGSYKLNVAGSIRADEIKVNTTGADFVFEPTYKLRSLAEVESFINQHKHLPEVAPATEMAANGVSVSDLQTKLLQKVEELTLYSIELEKKNAELQQQMKELKELVMKKLK